MKTKRIKGLTLADKLDLVTQCRTSGLPAKTWLQEHGIYEPTYYGWIKQLKKASMPCPEKNPIPLNPEKNEIVKLEFEEKLASTPQNTKPVLEIVQGDLTIRIFPETTKETLSMALETLRRFVC